MKKIIFGLASFVLLFTACNDKWDDHYENGEKFEVSNDNTVSIDKTVYEFLTETPEYSKFTEVFMDAELAENQLRPDDLTSVEELLGRDQKYTVWVVNNSVFDEYDWSGATDEFKNLIYLYHMNNLEYKYPELVNGTMIHTLSDGVPHAITHLTENNVSRVYLNYDDLVASNPYITHSYQLTNGTVHEVSKVLVPKISLYDYILLLSDDYSIIRDTIMNLGYFKFDKDNSVPIGVDGTGNTVYDSVKIPWNKIFDDNNEVANISDVNKKFTVIIPDDNAVREYWAGATAGYYSAGRTPSREDSLFISRWLKEAIIFSGTGMFGLGNTDVNSVYSRRWRTTVQTADFSVPEKMNNGELFYATKVKIPNYEILGNMWQDVVADRDANARYPYHTHVGVLHGRTSDIDQLRTADPDDERGWNAVTPIPVPPPTYDDANGTKVFYSTDEKASGAEKYSSRGWYKAMPIIQGFSQGDSGYPYVWSPNYGTTHRFYVNRQELYLDVPPLRVSVNLDGTFKELTIMEDIPVGEYTLGIAGRASSNATNYLVWFDGNPYDDAEYPTNVTMEGVEYVYPRLQGTIGGYFRGSSTGVAGGVGSVYVEPKEPGATVGSFRVKVEVQKTNPSMRMQWAQWQIKPTTNNY